MGDYMIDWSDGSMSMDGSMNGIPIPRSQHTQQYLRSDFSGYCFQFDHDSPSPSRAPLVPPNSLVNNIGLFSSQQNLQFEQQRGSSLSPYNSGSPLMSSNNIDLDMEIKMEPFDELLDISRVIHSNESHPPEDNLLDNVNFEDLLMPDEMESSTTCLDPQHSSPAAMATVHPDEVLGLMKTEGHSNYSSQTFTPINVPGKSEHFSAGGFAVSSFPPQGIGWKDPISSSSVPSDSYYLNQHQNFKNNSNNSMRLMPLGFSQSMQDQNDHETFNNNNNNNELLYSHIESSSNSALHELLVNSPTSHSAHPSPVRRTNPQEVPIGQSVPGAASFLTSSNSSLLSSRLSSSAPVNNFSLDQIWQRREPRQHLLSTGSLAEEVGGSTSSLSTGGGILSPAAHELSIDEGIDSEDDSDVDHYDSESDNDSIMSEETSVAGHVGMKKERHFWQYNVQAKGPKGQRVNITQNETDPHQLAKIMDPVFSPLCFIQGIKHSGKARRGDGNDLTPSPRKLVSIGLELSKLNKKINDMTPVSELPSTVRSKSRKEKNKLASRACRLKKKAQHEANKIKLYGLEQEHRGLLSIISKVRGELIRKVEIGAEGSPSSSGSESLSTFGSPQGGGESDFQTQQRLSSQIDKAAKMRTRQRIAGFTTDFVNKVIENCRNGNPTGGLDELAQTFVKVNLSTPGSDVNPDHELYT